MRKNMKEGKRERKLNFEDEKERERVCERMRMKE